METKNVMIVGVGGQGSLLASKLLGQLFLIPGRCEGFGGARHVAARRQRRDLCPLRNHVASPIIDEGEADYIVSFELLEAARWLPYLKKGGRIVTNIQQVDPMPVITGAMEYPEGSG
jgi:indolepyruvate ferredoxin oxidoreductase beta subunit